MNIEEFTPTLVTDDLERTKDYYQSRLGFGLLGYNYDSTGTKVMIYLENGKVLLIFRLLKPGLLPQPAWTTTIPIMMEKIESDAVDLYVKCRNVQQMYLKLRDAGAKIIQQPSIENSYEIVVQDDCGYRMAITEC